jgi:signal transduction histidine kinase
VTLRTKFFTLFTLLAVIPLVAVGAFSFLRSIRAVEALVGTQVEQIAHTAARQVADRYAYHQSNLLLLAGNAETQRLFSARANGDSAALAAAQSDAAAYLEEAWRALGAGYDWIELRDADGRILYQMGGDGGGPAASRGASTTSRPATWLTLREPILDSERSREVGMVVAAMIPDATLPFEALEARFGASGYSVVIDRSTGRVLYHPRHAYFHQTVGDLTGPTGWNIDPSIFEKPEGTLTYREADSNRVAYFQSLDSPPWTVLASGSVDEFGAPFAQSRIANLALILLLTVAVWIAYTLLARRATHSLAVLTNAADRVGAGDYAPALPSVGQDEVGRLTAAFQLMVTKVRESLQQMEASRQMAAVGAFASQISHEIRNPLTSLQLNLQGLQRDVERGRIPPDLSRPVELCLKEVHRLDGVVSGVLSLARPRRTHAARCAVHAVIEDALEVLRPQLSAAGVTVQTSLVAGQDVVLGDAEDLKSVLLNLWLNSAEAMPHGGNLCIATDSGAIPGGGPSIRVRVEDDGVGIPADVRAEIFNPFFTTKKGGTGIGLSVAARIIEEHHGDLRLADSTESGRGSAFVIELPLASKEPSR